MSIKFCVVAAGIVGGLLAPAAANAAPADRTAPPVKAAAAVRTTSADVSPQDSAFLVTVHQANLAEIAGGLIAETKGHHSRISSLAARFVADHTAMDAQLVQVAAAVGVTLPDAPDAAEQAQARQYADTPAGLGFERIWVGTQIYAHAKALVLGASEASTGQDPQVVQLATDAGPIVTDHKNRLIKVEIALYNGSVGNHPAPSSPTS